jgi:hypothetical protein
LGNGVSEFVTSQHMQPISRGKDYPRDSGMVDDVNMRFQDGYV